MRAELLKFGTVGAIAFVIDMGLFNLLALEGQPLDHKPTTAKILSAVVATIVSWLLNRGWTFAARSRANRWREFLGFALVNGAGIAVAAATLWVAVYGFDVTTDLGKNIASVLGIGLGTVVRYLGYKFLVFTGGDDAAPPPRERRAGAPDPERADPVRH